MLKAIFFKIPESCSTVKVRLVLARGVLFGMDAGSHIKSHIYALV